MSNDTKPLRLKTLQKRLAELGIDAALLILARDVFYYTGTAQPCILVVTPNDYLLIVRRALDFVLNETWLDTGKIIDQGSFQAAFSKLKELGVNKGQLGLELDVIPAELFIKIMQTFSAFEPVDIGATIMLQEMQKDPEEIDLIKTACQIRNVGHQIVLTALTEGMTELALAAEVEYAIRKAGHERALFTRKFDFNMSGGPLASGENLFKISGFANTITGVGLSAAAPAGPSLRKIKRGDAVVIDIPACYHGYHCDETRTYVLGKASVAVVDLFKALREISDQVVASLRAGVKCGAVFNAAYACACKLGVEQYFLGLPPRKANFVGHGVGLGYNEPPVLFAKSDFALRNNSVLTVEMHLTHPEHGVVKLEDMVLVQENGCEMLSVTEREMFVV